MPNSYFVSLYTYQNDRANTIFIFTVGETLRVCPVHAISALPASIQSVVPSRCTTVMEAFVFCVETRAVIGVVEEILWYKKGILRRARLKGANIDRVETA